MLYFSNFSYQKPNPADWTQKQPALHIWQIKFYSTGFSMQKVPTSKQAHRQASPIVAKAKESKRKTGKQINKEESIIS